MIMLAETKKFDVVSDRPPEFHIGQKGLYVIHARNKCGILNFYIVLLVPGQAEIYVLGAGTVPFLVDEIRWYKFRIFLRTH